MKNFLRSLFCGIIIAAVFVPLSLLAEIEGTYILEDSEEGRFQWTQPELTIEIDDDGEYSATLTKKSGEVLLDTKEVEIDAREFKATFTTSSGLGEFDITFAGRVKDSKLSGTISESLFGSEVKLVGKLKDEVELSFDKEGEIDREKSIAIDQVSTSSQPLQEEIEGTYLLTDYVAEGENERRYKWKNPELNIKADREGKYSATLTAGKVSKTADVEIDENEFTANFALSSSLGDFEITYAGRVEDGKLTGTISESLFDTESKLVGKLKNKYESDNEKTSD